MVDISNRNPLEGEGQHAEIQWRQCEEFLSSIYDDTEPSIFVVDVAEANDFHYISFNRSAQQFLGVSLQDVQHKTPEEVFGSALGTRFRQNYERCVRADSSITYEDSFIFNDRSVWTLTTLSPVRNEEGRIYRIVGTVIEITDRKQLELSLQASEAKLNQILDSAIAFD